MLFKHKEEEEKQASIEKCSEKNTWDANIIVLNMNTIKERNMQDPLEVEPPPGLLTIPQVAEYLGVCRAHVYKLIQNGLPVIRLGRLVRIQMTSLQRWLEEQEEITHL
jgi:excisionase family DNA binding protein